MGAAGLVADAQVEGAGLVVAERAKRVGNVVENVVLGDPAARVSQTAGNEIHAVGGRQGQLVAGRLDERSALRSINLLVLHSDTAARDGVDSGRGASLQVVPGIVADVVGTAGLVDAQKVDRAVAVGNLDAKVVAVDGAGPVGDAVGVDVAAENADRRRVAVVRSDRDTGGDGSASSRQGKQDVGGGEHVDQRLWGKK